MSKVDKGAVSPDDLAELKRQLHELLRSRWGQARIRCPKCAWVPEARSRWCCADDCLHAWNTFDTHGVCPRCRRAWKVTQCLSCHRYSPHEDWYVRAGPKDGAHRSSLSNSGGQTP